MANVLSSIITDDEHRDFSDFMYGLFVGEGNFFLRNDVWLRWRQWCREHEKTEEVMEHSHTAEFLRKINELLVVDNLVLIMHRPGRGVIRIYRMDSNCEYMQEISISRYLDYKDAHVLGNRPSANRDTLEIDFMPFYDYSPSVRTVQNVGNGISFLNKHLSSTMFQKADEWGDKLFGFIRLHKINGQQLLVNNAILRSRKDCLEALDKTIRLLSSADPETPYAKLERDMKLNGFEPGWGYNAARIQETMELLQALFYEPRSETLDEFIARVPMISKVAILSPHGWFGQENVLGKPDTGGQVIYILDQVRALEKYLLEEFALAGIDVEPRIIVVTRLIPNAGDTTCNQPEEDILGTDYAYILRIPFYDDDGNVVQDWISRFKIWRYLDRFAADCENELLAELKGRPDLIVGNYSDGNLVASLLSDRMGVIQCTIAHALEKTKYLFSDLFWQNMEPDYHFSCQYTADLISMNKSDFIITSTYQEIAGTDERMGQYESYQYYTMPGLYQVVNGINLYSPKFNVVPPGVDEATYFPYHRRDRRAESRIRQWEKRLFQDDAADVHGYLDDPDKPPVFTMARLDRIKNITGLVEAFGIDSELRKHANLIVAAGTIHADQSQDVEEKSEIEKMYRLIGQYGLAGSIRWLPSVPKQETGEVYRIIADKGGLFVQPALFEAFGLTVLEAMQCGLPTFGPIFGGPSEIIVNRKSGYLMNTSRPEMMAGDILEFLRHCEQDETHWKAVSEAGIRRVQERFTWARYSDKLIRLTKLYGFWRFAESEEGMIRMDRYCDLFYHLLLKPRASRVN